MTNFVQFLVEKNLIASDVLLDCLIEQLKTIPPTCQLVKDKKLMGTDQILHVLEKQASAEIGFKEACLALGFWNPELESNIKKELISVRSPLGNILLRRNLISLTELTKALDEFLSDDQNLLNKI
jgi:hypothetical protein